MLICERKELTKGKFDLLDDEQKEVVMEIVAGYHYRDGTPHADGSMGRVEITTLEMNDALAYCLVIS